MRPSFSSHPELRESLVELVERQQYSLTDVGLMFGVSRQRVQRWCARLGVRPAPPHCVGLYRVRVWDDALNAFRPTLGRGEHVRMQRRQSVARRRESRQVVRAQKQSAAVERVRALHTTLGRMPTVVELCRAVTGKDYGNTGAVARLVAAWSGRARDYARQLAELRRAAGVERRPLGQPGHVRSLPADPAKVEGL